ncbi:MAG: arginine repressor [Limosilactobacillus sp.]|uniref:arginine repressor n=1 Tax=Limosilactobacillus sp. TaxID=2773925 RepID=UPI0027086886|nr:arginine repressor [Limosilactobacillus sp.]
MDRKKRRNYIVQLVNENRIEKQDEILQMLNEAGYETTQATVSRDVRIMNIVKASDGNGHTYYVQLQQKKSQDFERLYQMIENNVVAVDQVQFMNVVKTEANSSYATILAGTIDEMDLPTVVGTIAGNDTMIIISKTPADAQAVRDIIKEHMR